MPTLVDALRSLDGRTVLIALFASVFTYIFVGGLSNYRKLSQFKGPPVAAFSRIWLFKHSLSADVNRAQFEALARYGSPCRIGPDLLITDDADLVRHMNAPGSNWRRSDWYDAVRLDPRHDSVFSTRDEKIHADLKAREAGGYQGRDIESLETDIDARTLDMLDLIKRSYNDKVMDVAEMTRFFTIDVLSTVAFGKPFGFLAANKDLWEYNQNTSSFMIALEWVANHKTIRTLFQSRIMQALAAPKETDKTGMGPMLAFARSAVAERFHPDPNSKTPLKKDMLNHFISKGLSQLQCEVEANLQIVAGSDSTTTVLRSALFLLISTPIAYNTLRQEIDLATAAGTLTSPPGVTKYTECLKLPYLSAVIWETLRLFPPLFGLKSKLSPPGGETFKGVFYPPGTQVAICDDALCRREDVFGADAAIFRPERWLEMDEANFKEKRRWVDAVFGSGRFLCLGRHIALMELHKAVVELIRTFDWQIADPMRGIDTHAHNIHVQSNMNVIARARAR